MKRNMRVFFFVLLALVIVLSGFTGGAKEEGKTKEQVIKFSTPVAPDHANTLAANKFAEMVNQGSGGRLKVEVFPANQLGNVKDVIEYLMTGSVHMYIGGTSETSLFQPEWGVMDCPYLFRDFDHLIKAANSDVIKEISDKLDKNRGVKILAADMYYGARHLTTRNKAVRTPADLKGMLIRAPDQPVYLEAVRAMGATPTPVAFSDLYMALKQGVVDGQENPIPTIYTYKYYEAQKYLMLTGHMLRVNLVGVSSSWYNSLPDDLKDLINKSLKEAVKYNNELTLKQENDMLEELKKLGMIVVQPDVEAFREAAKGVPKIFEKDWGKGTAERLAAIK
ncbi:MAG TPA: TRAP transporter substrate-binding protein [Spirochaetales bacterium]|nr:TRAP transporter substrate-binding protein [Spirochaetales bacterium]